jgi:hypothetical protein
MPAGKMLNIRLQTFQDSETKLPWTTFRLRRISIIASSSEAPSKRYGDEILADAEAGEFLTRGSARVLRETCWRVKVLGSDPGYLYHSDLGLQ